MFVEIVHDLIGDIVVTEINHAGQHDLKGVNRASFLWQASFAPAQRPTRMLQRAFKRSVESVANCAARLRGASETVFDILGSFYTVVLECWVRCQRDARVH